MGLQYTDSVKRETFVPKKTFLLNVYGVNKQQMREDCLSSTLIIQQLVGGTL